MSQTPRKLKLMFHSMEGTGHLNAALGMAQIMAKNGHEIVFAIHENLTKAVEKFGFRTIPLKQNTESNQGEKKFTLSDNPAKDFAAKLQESGLLSNKTPYEKMLSMKDSQFMRGLVQLMIVFDPQIEKLLKEEKPDVWLHDHFLAPPAVLKSGLPWALIASAAPLMYYQSDVLPPPSSGLSFTPEDKAQWPKFVEQREESRKRFRGLQKEVNDACNFVDPRLESSIDFWRSPYLNLYQFPLELEWSDVEGFKQPETFVGVDAFVRQEPGKFELPAEFVAKKTGSDKMIYLSMGSMGSFDIDMMQRMLKVLAKLPYKVIVSKGPRGDEYELPDNCWGQNYLPQPEIVEMVDLVMTHGGNNSFTETFAAGKKMIVMPLFGDQYDNAQRCQDKGYGMRIEPYGSTEQEIIDAVEKLMNDPKFDERAQAAKKRVLSSTRREEAARRVEQLARK